MNFQSTKRRHEEGTSRILIMFSFLIQGCSIYNISLRGTIIIRGFFRANDVLQ